MSENDNKIQAELSKDLPKDSAAEAALDDDLELTKTDGDGVTGGMKAF